jgi:3-deoxy-D-manno-octulosonate 8-phosphate phosphatase KdsC-like HAD superfamily phosphatase
VELRTKAKDMIKQAAGADTVREMADSIVENNGTLAQYRDALKIYEIRSKSSFDRFKRFKG